MMDDKDKSKEQRLRERETVRGRSIPLQESLDEHKRSENEILHMSKDWELTFDAVPDLLAIIDTNYRIVRVNKAMAEKLGVTKNEAVGLTCYKHIHNTEVPSPSCPHARMLNDGKEHFSEIYIEQLGGSYIVSVSPLRNEEEQLIGCVHVARDCTERKRAEEALLESEQSFRNIFEKSSVVMYLVEPPTLKIIDANPAAQRFYGYTREEFLTKRIPDLNVLPENEIREEIQRTKKAGGDTYIFKHRLSDGTVRDVEIRAVSITISGNREVYFSIVNDITERKKSEGRLQQTTERYHTILSQLYVGTLVVNEDNQIEYANQNLCYLFGLADAPSELIGLTADEMIKKILPACADSTDTLDRIRKIVAQKHRAVGEEMLMRDGRILLVDFVPILVDGKQSGRMWQYRDITELRQTMEALRLHGEIMANMVEGVILTRVNDGKIVYANPKLEEMFGYNRGELIGKHISLLNAPTEKSPEEIAKEITSHLKKNGEWNGEIRNRKKDGTYFWCYANVSSFNHLTYGDVWVSIHTDITERKKAEEALRQIEARFKMITDNMSDTIWFMDLNFKTTWISPSVERNRGYSLAEINALPLEKHLAPASLKIALETMAKGLNPKILQRKDLDLSTTLELEYFKKDGSTYWSEVRFSLLRDWEGVPICVLGVGRNITERKQAEEALKNSEQMLKRVIQGSPIPAFVIGKDHRVIYWNRALEELSGIKADEVAGTTKHWRAFYSEERPCMADLLVDQVLEVIPQWYFEKYIKSPLIEDAYEAIDFFPALGDTGKWLRFTAAVIRDFQGELVGAIETLQDVTERKQTRDTLEKLVQERTADLSMKNVQLINEIKERKQAEAELKRRKREVETKSRKLEELNTTLKTLLKHRNEDKEETEARVMSNVKTLLIPYIEKLKKSRLDAKSMFHVSTLESNLLDIISPFSHKLSSRHIYMTPKEIQVANLVKEGKSTKEIAEMMDVSSYAVELHRFNIRKKLGIKSRKINLQSYLLSIS